MYLLMRRNDKQRLEQVGVAMLEDASIAALMLNATLYYPINGGEPYFVQ